MLTILLTTKGLEILKNLGYTIQNFEGPNLAKQTHQAATLSRSGIWRYLEKRGATLNQEQQDPYSREKRNEKYGIQKNYRKKSNQDFEMKYKC